MATTQNGWTAHTTQAALRPLAYVTGRVHPAAYALFLHFCTWFNSTIEPIDKSSSWGWAYRPIRGATTGLSNHASGTAIDLNAPRHPMGKANTFTAAQQAKIRAQLSKYEGRLFWGGDWRNRPDDMHFEIRGTASQLAALTARLGLDAAKPAPTTYAVLRVGSRGDAVRRLQAGLNRVFPAYRHDLGGKLLAVDGIFGTATEAWVKEFQRRVGITADGLVGPATRAALARHGIEV